MNVPYRHSRAYTLALLATLMATPVLAQTQTSTLSGTVTGPDGALLPGVTATVTGPALMGSRTAVTNDTGGFRFQALAPGRDYVVELRLADFRTRRYEGLVLAAGQVTTVQAAMELSAITAEVSVQQGTPVIDIESPTTTTTFGPDLIANIPNSQRDWGQTVLSAPGVVDGANENFYGAMYSSRGGSVIANQAAVDGVINTTPLHNISQGSGTVFESIQEVQVVSGTLPAEIGNLGGVYVNVITKSGGNTVHGEAGVYYESDGLQSDNVDSALAAQGLRTATLSDFHDWGVNIGGPIMKDRLWFDGSAAAKKTATAVSGFAFDDDKSDQYYAGKLNWQLSPNHQLTGLVNSSAWTIPYTGASQFITPEATVASLFETRNYKVKWTGVLSGDLLLEADLGVRDSDQSNAPQADARHAYLDVATGVISGANFTYFDIDYRRTLPKAVVSWFKPGAGGSHQFKFGVELEDSSAGINRYGTGPLYFHYMVGGAPTLALFWNQAQGVLSKYEMNGLHVFAQDSWNLSPRVTLNLGVRLNTWKGTWPEQSNPGFTYGANVNFAPAAVTSETTAIEWSPVEPRIAASIALDESRKTMLRVGGGRYHHGLDLSYFQGSNPMQSALSIHPWVDFDGDKFADANEVLAPVSVQVSGGAASPIDPDLRNPYTDELTIGVAREIFADASVTINASWRRDHDLIDDVSTTAQSAQYQTVAYPDPGPDGRANTSDDRTIDVFNQTTGLGRPNLLQITNPPRAEREYKSVELILSKRLTRRWQALASLVWQQATGTLQTNRADASGNSAAFNDPNTEINMAGPTVLDAEWQSKIQGTYLAPWGIAVSGYFLQQSGVPMNRVLPIQLAQGPITIVADPKGTWREDSLNRLDLRIEKTFTVGGRGTRISVMADVFNLLNAAAITNRNESTTAGGGFQRPLSVQPPRTARLGARVRF